jgi:NhaP-type Na+/H+ and K+/H+ antiporter
MLAVGGVLAASVAVAFGAAKSGLPAVVAFLGLGMMLGADGPGGTAFDDAELAREVAVVSLRHVQGPSAQSDARLPERAGPRAHVVSD